MKKELQYRVNDWMEHVFPPEIINDVDERGQRFIEEAIELVQSTGMTAQQLHNAVDYVFGRCIGEVHQEVGGVMISLSALCNVVQVDMNDCAETELRRIWNKADQIKERHKSKPKF